MGRPAIRVEVQRRYWALIRAGALPVEAGTVRGAIQNLRAAMVTRALIEQAKGVIMTLRRCSAEEAFRELEWSPSVRV